MSDDRKGWQDPDSILRSIGVKRGMTVADLGCGPGFFTLPIASMVGEKGRVYSVDSNATMVSHLLRNIESTGIKTRVEALHADVSKTGIPTGSVDVALFANILHDIEDTGSFLREVRRICKPGASMVNVDWKPLRMELGPPLEVRLSEEESERILSEGGLRVTRRIEAGPYHYGLVCQRSSR